MNTSKFHYASFKNKVLFGEHSFQELEQIGKDYRKVFLIATSRLDSYAKEVDQLLDKSEVLHFSKVVQHVPESLVNEAIQASDDFGTDLIIALGGGSAIGLAKAMALKNKVDIIAIPTTFSGSEMTNIWGISRDGAKETGRDPIVLPSYTIYDPSFTATMPYELAFKSAMNAMAHLIEAVYAPDANPITYTNSLLGIKKLSEGIQRLLDDRQMDSKANELILFGAFLAGKGLCEVSMSLHHKSAHVLGGSFGLDHSTVHTILQAYVLEFQWSALTAEVKEDFRQAYQADYPPATLQAYVKDAGLDFKLQQLDFIEEDIVKAADIILSKPYANPRKIDKEGLLRMLSNAYHGVIELN